MGRRWLAAVAAALVMAKVAQVVVPAAETSPAPIAGTAGSRPFRDKFGVVGLEQQPASAGRDQLRRATFGDGTRLRFARDSPLEESGFEPLVPLTPEMRPMPGVPANSDVSAVPHRQSIL
jgi:hypothetical protein